MDVLPKVQFEITEEPATSAGLLLTSENSVKDSNTITFFTGDKKMLELKPNGDILVKGRLVENDKEVVDALREFIKYTNNNGQV